MKTRLKRLLPDFIFYVLVIVAIVVLEHHSWWPWKEGSGPGEDWGIMVWVLVVTGWILYRMGILRCKDGG